MKPDARTTADRKWEEQAKQRANGADSDPPRRFKPIRFRDIKLGKEPAYIVRRTLPRGGLIVIWGPPKCGKSFWMQDLAMHVARSLEYRGRRVRGGAVVYVAAEGEQGQGARAEAYRQRHLAGSDEDPPFYLIPTRLDLVKDVDQLIADIRATIGLEQLVLIVIDTLNRTLAGSESKDEDMTAYVGAAGKLQQAFSSAVAVIHHCGTNENRPRGHTALTGAVEAQIAVKRGGNGEIIATVEYMKDGPEGDVITSRLVPVDVGLDEDGEIISSCVVEPVDDDVAQGAEAKPSAAKSRPGPSAKNRVALDILRKAISVHGQAAPPHPYIPSGAVVTSLDLWRRFYFKGTSADGQSEDTRGKAWRRAVDKLQADAYISICDEMVWIV